MAEKPTKGGNLGEVSQTQTPVGKDVSDEKDIRKATIALDSNTRGLQDHTRKLQADTKERQLWGRMAKEQETQLERLTKGFHELTGQLLSTKRMWEDTTGVMSGYGRKLGQMTSLSTAYAAKLKYVREGQAAYTSTLIATTNNVGEAMNKSQKYVNAVHASYTNAKAIAGEFNVETAALDKAAGELTARFATQIAVSNDMSGAMKGMQREAFLLGAYLGVEMSEVMDMWQEQLDSSIKTLDEAREEIMAVTKITDKYAQEIQNLGKDYLKTGNIGKKEFLTMVRSIGKELRTGTFNASAYAKAIKGVLIASKEDLHTTNEQRVAQEGLVKITKQMFTMGTKYSVFGMRAADEVMAKWDDPKWMASIDQKLRKRLEITKREFAGSSTFERQEAIMGRLKASGAGTAMGFEQMGRAMNSGLQRQVMKGEFEGDANIANTLAKQIKSGEIAQNFREKSAKEAKDAKEVEGDMWKTMMGDLVKAGHTSESADDRMIRQLDSIDKYIQRIYTQFPLMLAGAQLAGGLLSKAIPALLTKLAPALAAKLGMGAAAVPGMASFIAPTMPAAAGALSTTAAIVGPVVAVLGAAAVGAAIGKYIVDPAVGQMLFENKDTQRRLGDDKTLSNYLSGGVAGWFTNVPEEVKDAMVKMQEETTRISGGEFQARKDIIKEMGKQIDALERNRKNLDHVEQQKLENLKKNQAAETAVIARRLEREQKETEGYKLAEGVSAREKMRAQLRAKPGDAEAFIKGAGFTMPELGMADFGQQLMDEIMTMPDEIREQIGDPKAFVEKAQASRMKHMLTRGGYGVTQDELKGKSLDEVSRLFEEKTGRSGVGPVTAMSRERAEQVQEAQQRASSGVEALTGKSLFGDTSAGGVKMNAKGDIQLTSLITVPGYSLNEILQQLNNKTPKPK